MPLPPWVSVGRWMLELVFSETSYTHFHNFLDFHPGDSRYSVCFQSGGDCSPPSPRSPSPRRNRSPRAARSPSPRSPSPRTQDRRAAWIEVMKGPAGAVGENPRMDHQQGTPTVVLVAPNGWRLETRGEYEKATVSRVNLKFPYIKT